MGSDCCDDRHGQVSRHAHPSRSQLRSDNRRVLGSGRERDFAPPNEAPVRGESLDDDIGLDGRHLVWVGDRYSGIVRTAKGQRNRPGRRRPAPDDVAHGRTVGPLLPESGHVHRTDQRHRIGARRRADADIAGDDRTGERLDRNNAEQLLDVGTNRLPASQGSLDRVADRVAVRILSRQRHRDRVIRRVDQVNHGTITTPEHKIRRENLAARIQLVEAVAAYDRTEERCVDALPRSYRDVRRHPDIAFKRPSTDSVVGHELGERLRHAHEAAASRGDGDRNDAGNFGLETHKFQVDVGCQLAGNDDRDRRVDCGKFTEPGVDPDVRQ